MNKRGQNKSFKNTIINNWIHLLPTCISSCDNLLQDLLFESPQQGLHNHVVVCAGCESHQGGGGGCARQLDLSEQSEGDSSVSRLHLRSAT